MGISPTMRKKPLLRRILPFGFRPNKNRTYHQMKLQIIGLTLLVLFFIVLLHYQENFTNPQSEQQRFDDKALYKSVIPNMPAPAGTNQTDRLLYSNADIEANITDIKNKLTNLDMNVPIYVRQGVEQQLKILMAPCPKH